MLVPECTEVQPAIPWRMCQVQDNKYTLYIGYG